MMKKTWKFAALLQLAVLCAGLLLPVAAGATFVEHEGLEVTVEMDKEQYDADEAITATITVKNTNTEAVTIANLEQLIPEGYRLAEDSRAGMQDIELRPEQTMVLEVTFVAEEGQETPEAAGSADPLDKLLYGETMGVPNLLIAVILVIGFVIFMLLT